jgi:hypothetical protein
MMICQIDARIPVATQNDIEHELRLLGDVLEALDGELIGAEIGFNRQSLSAFIRVESEIIANDIFEASLFAVERIAYLGESQDPKLDLHKRKTSQGLRQYSAQAAIPILRAA